MADMKALGGEIWTKPFKILTAFAVVAVILILKRFIFGLGDVTNMSDGYPWGIWIAYDVVTGTAIACGGYAMALLVYVFNKGEYHPLVRPAILASMFGYTLAGVSIFFDVGRYWQAYNLFLPSMSNYSSVLYEVALCITIYIFVLMMEFYPALSDGGKKKPLNIFMILLIALGVLLPTMHQSSLGSLLIIAGRKLSPLWQSNLLPLLFLISALMMGYAIVIFESIISSKGFKRPVETELLGKLSGVIPTVVGLFLAVRAVDLLIGFKIKALFAFNFKSLMFLVEIALFVYPLMILMDKANRSSAKQLFISASMLLLAGSVYRVNAFLIGFDPGYGWRYFPSLQELLVTFGIIAMELMAYLVLVKKLPVLPEAKQA